MDNRERQGRPMRREAAQRQENMARQQEAVQPQESPVRRHEQAAYARGASGRTQAEVKAIEEGKAIISQIERLLKEGYRVPMKRGYALVNTDAALELLGRLLYVQPEAVDQARAVLAQKDRMLSEASAESRRTISDGENQFQETKKQMKAFKQQVQDEADRYDKETRLKADEDSKAIIADANARAEQITFAAQQKAQQMVDENEISRRAQAYALETRERVEKDADSIYNQACVHVDKMLSGAAAALSRSAGELATLRDNLLSQGGAAPMQDGSDNLPPIR